MGLQDQAGSERVHIAFLGMRNAGKSSLVNAVTGQQISLVSEVKGTTTDPVTKSMELAPLGPVVIIDTPGIDDEGVLGSLRAGRARRMLSKTDIAVLVVSAEHGLRAEDRELLKLFEKRNMPCFLVFNKMDLPSAIVHGAEGESMKDLRVFHVSAKEGRGIHELKEGIAALAGSIGRKKPILSDLVSDEDLVILVTPIDQSAPKGRLILPQQLVLREILDCHAMPLLVQTEEYGRLLCSLKGAPALVVTDSQVFREVARETPPDVPLTSFSILMARYKGTLADAVKGAGVLKELPSGSSILISEGCTHHRQCEDIGTVKLPGWISEYTGKEFDFHFTQGGDFPEDLSPYSLVIHCGGCMLNEREMQSRLAIAREGGVPMTNYGIIIAMMNGILARSLEALGWETEKLK